MMKTIRLLLVEDNEMNRDMLSRRLASEGFELVSAETGQQAIDMAQSEQPDLILMDMGMPVMDGWEATRILKSSAETKHIPIIALTAHAFTQDEERSRQAGCDDFLTKPIDFPRLLKAIEQLLN